MAEGEVISMKLEMGESLISSWLKHGVGCKIVQLNWKADKSWKGIDEKKVKTVVSDAKKYFRNYGQDFSKQDSQPFILQGEIDVLGYDWDNNIFYLTDIAFHENNLSRAYMRRIAKK